jgi:hypothetical protein
VLKSIHSSVGHLDFFVQRQEGSLQRGDLNEQIQNASEFFPAFLN